MLYIGLGIAIAKSPPVRSPPHLPRLPLARPFPQALGSRLAQQPLRLPVAVLRRQVHRPTAVGHLPHLRPGLQEQPEHLGVPLVGRRVQRRGAVQPLRLQPGARVKQRPAGAHGAPLGGQQQRRGQVVAHRHVAAGAEGQEQLHEVPVAVVGRRVQRGLGAFFSNFKKRRVKTPGETGSNHVNPISTEFINSKKHVNPY